MAKKIYGVVASCITVILALTFGELPSKAVIHDQPQRQAHRDGTSRRNRAARKRVQVRRKEGKRRLAISYVCPMHLDIRSDSRGTCPKCLMELVAERRSAKVGRR